MNTETFTTEYWKSFIEKNNNFSKTCVIKDSMSPELLSKLNKGVMQVLVHRLSRKDINYGFRVYIEGKEQNDEFLNSLCKNIPYINDDVKTYTEKIFDKKFGMIINDCEKHSELIAENVIESINPLIELVGLPPLGVEITIFIGNYGWTPLGIHQDHKGENVIHFHLGPGSKTMYVWDEEKYKELTGNKPNNMDIEPLLPYAKEFLFSEGDLYYMPWNKYHVGYTKEFSVGITLWFNNPSKYKYVNRILQSFRYQFIKKDTSIIGNKFNLIENKENSKNDVLDTIELDNNILSGSVSNFFGYITNEFNYCLLSNGGWQAIPLSQKELVGYKVDEDYMNIKNHKIQSSKNFKILYQKDDNTLFVYVRGSKFSMQYYIELTKIIDEINKNEIIDLEKYILRSENFSIPEEAFFYFLSLIYDKRGFKIIS